MSSRGSYVLASVSRTVRTVELVAESGAMRLAELASCLGVSRPGAFRIAQTLVAHRWLVQGTDRRYRIGPAVRALPADPGSGPAEGSARRPGRSTDA